MDIHKSLLIAELVSNKENGEKIKKIREKMELIELCKDKSTIHRYILNKSIEKVLPEPYREKYSKVIGAPERRLKTLLESNI